MKKTQVLVIGDSYTLGLFKYKDDLTIDGKDRLKGHMLPRLSLSKYVLGPTRNYGYLLTENEIIYGQASAKHNAVYLNMTKKALNEIDMYANENKKIKGIDIFLSFGHCDIFFEHYTSVEAINASKAGKYHKSNHCFDIIENYKKLISDIKNKFNEPNIHIISIQGYMTSAQRLLTDATPVTMRNVDKPAQLDFYGIRKRVLIVNDKLKNMATSLNIDYIDINKYLWDNANNNYYGVYYDYIADDFHVNPWAIKEIMRMESPLFNELLKSDKKTLDLIKNTEAYKINKKITGGFTSYSNIIFIIQIIIFVCCLIFFHSLLIDYDNAVNYDTIYNI